MQDNQTQRIMNVPNILSLLRMVLVPVFMASVFYLRYLTGNPWVLACVPAALFAVTSLTDMLDGKIARRYGLITDFGKFLDPLADKFMVFGALICFVSDEAFAPYRGVLVWVAALVMLRELGVTSLRLVVAARGVVVPASIWGKLKTVSQIFVILFLLLEPAFRSGATAPIAYAAMAVMCVTTLFSGIDYLRALWPYVAGKK